jgi:GDP/UDP-N,N'-diacetylbacillosamine 2-epimerase (hydrolysing)
MHYSPLHGETWREVEASGLAIVGRCRVGAEGGTRRSMGEALANAVRAFMPILEGPPRPDIVLLLGDRGEMLAGALAALYLNVPIAHIHGGERTGTIDDSVRHAISKLSHYHFTATASARERLIRMGERPECVHVTGAPGLDGIAELASMDRRSLCAGIGLDPARPLALVLLHPVVQTAETAGLEAQSVLDGLLQAEMQCVCFVPNSDAGSPAIRAAVTARTDTDGFVVLTHVPRRQFVSWMAAADVMVGNSSSGIIEAASFGTPVVNIGSRQHLRDRSQNVTDSPAESTAVAAAVRSALQVGRFSCTNVYGDGHACERITSLLETVPLDLNLLMKSNSY